MPIRFGKQINPGLSHTIDFLFQAHAAMLRGLLNSNLLLRQERISRTDGLRINSTVIVTSSSLPRDPKLKGGIGVHSALHAHDRKLE